MCYYNITVEIHQKKKNIPVVGDTHGRLCHIITLFILSADIYNIIVPRLDQK